MKTRTTFFFLLLTILWFALSTSFADTIYDNGPINGHLNALFINASLFRQTISDGFVATISGNATTLNFGEWILAGTYPTSLFWSLGTTSFGSDISSGSTPQVGYAFLFGNEWGYDVYDSSVAISGLLTAGSTYYVTLADANDWAGTGQDAWDENDGPAICYFENPGGSGPCEPSGFGSESFTIGGSGSTTTTSTTGEPIPEPGTILLFGSGILGLAGGLRRMLHF